MALAETARLVVDLAVNDQLTPALQKSQVALQNLSESARLSAGKISDSIGNAGDQIRARFAGIGPQIQQGIGIGLGFGVASITAQALSEVKDFVASSVDAARQDELSQAKLTQTLKANVVAWDENSAAIERRVLFATQSAFTDDEVRQSLSSLVAATHDVNRAFSDQAIAIDLARFKNISLQEASQQLVAIEAGRFRGLAQLGIQLKAGATAEDALAQVRAVVAGQSTAFLETDAGRAAKLTESVDHLSEAFGRLVTGPLATVSDALANALDFATGVKGEQVAAAGDQFVSDIQDHFTNATLQELENLRKVIADELDKSQHQLSLFGVDLPVGNFVGESDAIKKALDEVDAKILALNVDLGSGAESARGASQAFHELDVSVTGVGDSTQGFNGVLNGMSQQTGLATDAFAQLGTTAQDNFARAEAAAKSLNVAIDGLPREIPIDINVGLFGAGAGLLATGGLSQGNVGAPGNQPGAEGSLPAGFSNEARVRAAEDAAAERKRKADQAAREAAAKAKQDANELAQANREKVANSYDAAKRASDRLFDSLHDRHIKAIKDAENLAEKNHDAAVQQIADNLAAAKQANAAPVTAAEQAQSAAEHARQLRDLQESIQAAQQALATNRDQSQVAGLQRSLRDAVEALQSFNAQDAIDKLKVAQTANDTAAEQAAKQARDKADADLEAAKLQAAASEALVNKQDAKKKQDFDVALAALKKKDEGSPAQFLIDLKSLETKFGIFTDQRGFTHIGDVVADAIKNTKPPDVHITLQVPRGAIQLNGRDVNNASTVGISPTQAQSTRSGQAKPKGN